MTWLTAMLAFGSFVANDVLGHYKDLASSVEAAETTFLIRSDISDFRIRVAVLFAELREEQKGSGVFAPSLAWVQSELAADLIGLDRRFSETLSRLAGKLPHPDERKRQIAAVERRLEGAHAWREKTASADDPFGVLGAVGVAFGANRELDSLVESLLTEARTTAEAAHKTHRLVTGGLYALVVVLGVLDLLGKVALRKNSQDA